MKTNDFYFEFPEDLIAQEPLPVRSASKLLVLHKETGQIDHRKFTDLPDYLEPGDCLVMNDTKVIPARLNGVTVQDTFSNFRAVRAAGGKRPWQRDEANSACEFLLLKNVEGNLWECLVRPGKKLKPGSLAVFGTEGLLSAEVKEILDDGVRLVKFYPQGSFDEVLKKIGEVPLPPYIHQKLNEPDRYQTVYAKEAGSAAAPTAGLHFTESMISQLKDKGIKIADVTLHVGLATFRPVKEENVEDHEMHKEWYRITKEAAETINAVKKAGKKVVCVGTTSCRTIETVAGQASGTQASGVAASRNTSPLLMPSEGDTKLFIYPGYQFKITDALVTNFHLPGSTLLMLVSAMAGREKIMKAYEDAIRNRYRFFSFGDAMLIL